ncbi:MAG: hypothetical protein PHW46_01575 [Candidatus Omnitrophica bacterium]|nr:hypothetical protein [Candidatus Omnitrophota bacterium]
MKTIVALGTENKTSFSVVSKGNLFTSGAFCQLSDVDKFNEYEKAIKSHLASEKVKPDVIVCDMHPDYASTALAETLFSHNKKSRLMKVQHHFAHIVSAITDNAIKGKVIGVSFDGTGYGDDGNLWGSEFLICDKKSYTRKHHLEYVAIPGGDIAISQVWRMALSYLYHAYGEGFTDVNTPLLKRIQKEKVKIIKEMLVKKINSPLSSSAGRLFDAVSSLTGLCDVAKSEAEGAMLLEKIADLKITDTYSYVVDRERIIVSRMIKEIDEDINNGAALSFVSAKFHNTVGEIIYDVSSRIYRETGIDKVLVSGGCFQNRYLVDYIENKFTGSKLKLYKHKNFPTTDMNISIGQAIVAASAAGDE